MSQEPSSLSFCTANEFRPIRSAAIRAVSSEESTPTPLIFNCMSWPWSSTCGARPGENIRSLVFGAACNMDAMMLAVGAWPTCSAAGAAGAIGATVGAIFESAMASPPQPSGKGPARRLVLYSMNHAECEDIAECAAVLKELAVLLRHCGEAGGIARWAR